MGLRRGTAEAADPKLADTLVRVRLSLAQWLLGPDRLQDALTRLADLGYQGVEVRASNLAASGEEVSAVAAAARRAGIVPSVHGPTLGSGSTDAAAAALAFAAELGAPVVVLHPAAAIQGDHDDAWHRSFAALDELVSHAERLGVTLTIENMERRPGEVVVAPDDLRRLRDRYASTAFSLTVDYCHAATHGLIDGFLGLAGDAAHVHLSDHNAAAGTGAAAHLARWGEGDVDFRRIHDALATAGYSGAVVAEGEPGAEPWVTIEANARLWRAFI